MYKLSRIETYPILYDGIWIGSAFDVYVDISGNQTLNVKEVYERERVKAFKMFNMDFQNDCARALADLIIKGIAKQVKISEQHQDLKSIRTVLRSRLPTFMNYAAETTLYLMDCDTWKATIKKFEIMNGWWYNPATVDFEEWPWCKMGSIDLEKIIRQSREDILLTDIVLGKR